jgi:hypothetical protein
MQVMVRKTGIPRSEQPAWCTALPYPSPSESVGIITTTRFSPMVLSKEEINRIAAETRVPENIVKNIVEADGGERSAEEIRDTILDMFRERGTSDLGPSGRLH